MAQSENGGVPRFSWLWSCRNMRGVDQKSPFGTQPRITPVPTMPSPAADHHPGAPWPRRSGAGAHAPPKPPRSGEQIGTVELRAISGSLIWRMGGDSEW